MKETRYIIEKVKNESVLYLGKIDFDHILEDKLGDVKALRTTNFYSAMTPLIDYIKENL